MADLRRLGLAVASLFPLAFFPSASFGAEALALARAERPTLRVGDSWTVEIEFDGRKHLEGEPETVAANNYVARRTITYEVQGVSHDWYQVNAKGTFVVARPEYNRALGQLKIRLGQPRPTEGTRNLDHDLNWVRESGEKELPVLQWPIEIGRKWSTDVVLGGIFLPKQSYSSMVEVGGVEYIETQHGTLPALRIRSNVPRQVCFFYHPPMGGDLVEGWKRDSCMLCKIWHETWVHWYSPDAKAILKAVGRLDSKETLPGCPLPG